MKTVNILAFNGCEDVELFAVVDILKRCEIGVNIISPEPRDFTLTKSGIRIKGGESFKSESFDLGDADAFYMPGGSIVDDFTEFADSYDSLISQITEFIMNGKIVSANCIAPALLASIGAFNSVENYQITCYPGTEVGRVPDENLAKNLSHKKVHLHENILTGNGPSASVGLAHALASLILGSSKLPDQVLVDMGYSEAS